MKVDSTQGTIIVAFVLCVVCSVLVSTSAVQLKPLQDENKKLDVKKNLLLASGLLEAGASKEDILEKYKLIRAEVVDLDSGEVVEGVVAETFDQKKASKTPGQNKRIDPDKDLGDIKRRAKRSIVYKVMDGSQVKMLVLPINGKGLWSTLYGFIALAPDTRTVKGIGFYQHGETPGLGGEVDNPNWKASWAGKTALNEKYEPVIRLIKGQVDPNGANAAQEIDGLSGATITANGVTGLVQYWLGQDGFGPYLAKFRATRGGL